MTTIITAYDRNLGIGLNGKLPWSYPVDMKHFRNATTNHIVVAGRVTADDVFPLPNRICVMLSNNIRRQDGWLQVTHVDDLAHFRRIYPDKQIFVIGGEKTYKQFLDAGLVDTILATEIDVTVRCDTFFPIDPSNSQQWKITDSMDIVGNLKLPNGVDVVTAATIVRYDKT